MREEHLYSSGFGKFGINTTEELGKKFRDYCSRNNLIMGRVLEDLMIDYLVSHGEIKTEEEQLLIQMGKRRKTK